MVSWVLTVPEKPLCLSASAVLKPEEGHIWVNGQEVGKDVDFPPSLGMIIENPGFLPRLTGLANLKRLAAINRVIKEQEIRENIRKVGLDPDSSKKWGNILWECGNVWELPRHLWRTRSFSYWTSLLMVWIKERGGRCVRTSFGA